MTHRAILFDCKGARLAGIAEIPPEPRRTGLLVITGGPQYRIGSHRQFTLLCRGLASERFASLRFDFRGCGDSEGRRVAFSELQPDIAAATDRLFGLAPQLSQVVLLGLCDGASAALMSAPTDARFAGVVMLNPWVRTTGSLEQARVRGYYPARLASGAFWQRLLSGKVNVFKSLKSFREQVAVARTSQPAAQTVSGDDYLPRMLAGARQFEGELLVILSGQDMTAQEYRDLLAASDDWRSAMSEANVQHREVPDANHTFASADWRAAVADHCLDFLRRLDAGPDRGNPDTKL